MIIDTAPAATCGQTGTPRCAAANGGGTIIAGSHDTETRRITGASSRKGAYVYVQYIIAIVSATVYKDVEYLA
jgi:hypothetical protein